MDLFGRKRKKREEEEEQARIEEEERERKINLENKKLKKKLKDLTPENSRKRKEPPKPWGKSERIIVASAFLFTTLIATMMFLESHEYKFPGLPKITLKGINIKNPFGEKVIELGQKSKSTSEDETANRVISKFNDYIKPLSGFYGFSVVRLSDGFSYGVSADKNFQAASMLKLPLMAMLYKMQETGAIDLNTEYTLKNEDKVKGAGSLYNAPAGSIYTYRELINLMGKESDRTAYKVMKEIVGEESYRQFLYEAGLVQTDIDTGMTTPQEMATLLYAIGSGEMLNEDNANELKDNLTNTEFEAHIASGVPEGIRVAHKFGTDVGVVADGGIIEAENPYVLVVMSQGITGDDADVLIPKFSKDVYNFENSVQ